MDITIPELLIIALVILTSVMVGYALGVPKKDEEKTKDSKEAETLRRFEERYGEARREG